MVIDTTPKAFPRRPIHPELAVEYDRFQTMLPGLMKAHRGKWIAMKEGVIVAVADDEVEALTLAGEAQPGVLHYADCVTDQPLPIDRLPLMREVRRGEP